MSRIVEQMMLEERVSGWKDAAKKMMEHFKISADEAIAVLEIPDAYRDAILAALK